VKIQRNKNVIIYLSLTLFLFYCSTSEYQEDSFSTSLPSNILDYTGTPSSPKDRSSLAFSDQGAWFAFGFSNKENKTLGFSGPFLMTQGQGEWSSKVLSQLELTNRETGEKLDLNDFSPSYTSYNSHLNQVFQNKDLKFEQNLFFNSPHSAIITTQITNFSDETIALQPSWNGATFSAGLIIKKEGNTISLTTDRSSAKGVIQTFEDDINHIITTDSSYFISLNDFELKTSETKTLTISHTFIFPEYDAVKEQKELELAAKSAMDQLHKRIKEKEEQLTTLNNKLGIHWQDNSYKDLVAKTVLTLQNNTRIGAGELKHAGIFPSYHYKWFLGFWAWDSWKHAVAVSHYNSELAKDQIRVIYDYQLDNGFVPDCIFRDTTIEKHNYRNTKPPLSAWAVWNVYKQDGDGDFIREMYPKIIKQHNWWYEFRDYDKDRICEYGSTDGTLVAAKWESGMDNAVRFDKSKMVKSAQTVFSLNQESVDLNAYLYAEKLYLAKMAKVVKLEEDVNIFSIQAKNLKVKIQNQFFDEITGWFYDTSIDGETFVDVMGCEGWIPLWVNAATNEQAEAVKNNMINPNYFNTKIPFQTLSASHPSFKPDRGYWRGPNWLDQAYFGVVGLHNYGYHEDAYKATYKLIHNAKGVLGKGTSIRENYNPITGEGLESQNFSWSAGHYLLLLLNE
jgi:putative isomerase